MGYSSWSSDAYDHLKDLKKGKSRKAIFSSTYIHKTMDPKGVDVRESRDSAAHPESLPVAVFLDVTGSMGRIPEIMVREKLGALMDTLIDHGVEHPQILFGAIGDHISDRCPLQIGQFESGTDELDMWLTRIYLEGGGGGQNKESYLLSWLFAARHTSLDSFEKRGQKGFLFTIGDEWCWETLDAKRIKALMGYSQADDIHIADLLEEAKRMYEVFHIHVNEASYRDDPRVIEPWKRLLGERLIILDDYNAVAETIAATVAVLQGVGLSSVTASFDSSTSKTVSKALAGVSTSLAKPKVSGGILKL